MKQDFFKFFYAVLFIVCADIVGAGLWAWATTQTFEKNVPKIPIAAVFSSDYPRKSNELSSETRRRLNHAVRLYKEGTIQFILCIGGKDLKNNTHDAELMRDFLLERDFPQENIFLEKQSSDIRTNWYRTCQIISGHGWHRIIIVASPFYLHRFRGIIKREPRRPIAAYYSPYPIGNADPELTYLEIWKQVHYEAMIYVSELFPKKTYDEWIKKIRGSK